MIELDKLEYWAGKKEKKNLKFRTFLKTHADPKELDRQFAALHKELFAQIDCSKCRNCCKKCHGTIPFADIGKDAEFLGMAEDEFRQTYLQKEADAEGFNTINVPCDFLRDNECILADNMPVACKDFPHTDKPNRLESLFAVLDFTFICPVVYEIVERLKEMYNFM